MALPEDVLVAMIRRRGRVFVPRGGTVLRAGDRLTVIGEPDSLVEVAKKYAPKADVLKQKQQAAEAEGGSGNGSVAPPAEVVKTEDDPFVKDQERST